MPQRRVPVSDWRDVGVLDRIDGRYAIRVADGLSHDGGEVMANSLPGMAFANPGGDRCHLRWAKRWLVPRADVAREDDT